MTSDERQVTNRYITVEFVTSHLSLVINFIHITPFCANFFVYFSFIQKKCCTFGVK